MKAMRLVKVRDAIVLLSQLSEGDGTPKTYDELSQEDQDDATLAAKGMIQLVDGLMMPYRPKGKTE